MNASYGKPSEETKSLKPMVVRTFVVSLVISFMALYQAHVGALWDELPPAAGGDLDATRTRLAAVSTLMDRHPLWVGSYTERNERSELSMRVVQLETEKTIADSRSESDEVNKRLAAESAREQAGGFVMQKDFKNARLSLEKALKMAPEGWSGAEQVRADLAAVKNELEVTE